MKKFVLVLLLCSIVLQVKANDNKDEIDKMSSKFETCSQQFDKREQECPESWSMKCFDHLIKVNRDTQQCYQDLAVRILKNFYGLSTDKANKKLDDYKKFIYEQYSFMYWETNFCKKNNCGISPNLYSEYATTQELQFYINKMIGSILSRL